MTLFGLDNLPYGVFSAHDAGPRRVGVRLGDGVVDLWPLARYTSLNPLLAAGPERWAAFHARVRDFAASADVIPLADVALHMPFEVADYTDFYSCEQHAINAGKILRPNAPGLPPAWRHLPIGYHGRSGTVVVSGTPIPRPAGQTGEGSFGPSAKLDVEAEVGFVVGTPGRRVPTSDLARHVFGVVLVNDWSARDLQAFEARPLGPFLAKSFATSISPWVVPLASLAPVEAVAQDPVPHDYLRPAGPSYDIRLTIDWNGTRVSSPRYSAIYWTAAQQLAHLTVNGACVRTGDLYASGTISSGDDAGSFLEMTWDGTAPIRLADGSERGYLLDGDRVTIGGTALGASGHEIGLGEVTGVIVP